MLAALTVQQIIFFIILIAAFVLLLTEWVRNDIVALLVILGLAITGLLKSTEALSGFGSEPAIVVAAIFVLSDALHQTGISEVIGAWVAKLAGSGYTRAVSVIMLMVAAFSAFTHHVTTTAIMLPVTLTFARKHGIPASKLLMPLSFAASLGTTITIIGAPAFLVASASLQQAGRPGLGLFSIAPIGIALSVIGTLFMVLIGRHLLPSHDGSTDLTQRFRVDQYFTELKILPDSPFIGKNLAEIKQGRYGFTVVGWLREARHLAQPFTQWQFEIDDVLLVHTAPDDLVAFRHERGIEIHPLEQYSDVASLGSVEEFADELVQVVVAPEAEFIGRSLRELDFRRRYGPIVVGFWRQNEFLKEELARIRLRAGDVLVLQGDKDALARVEQDPGFLMLMAFQGEPRLRQKAPWAAGIMLATILATAFNLLPLEIASLAGATAIVLTGCLTPRQAYRAIEVRIYVFIAGAIPLGLAMQQTGTAKLLAGLMKQFVQGWPELIVLLVIYAVVGLVTQLMSDAATVALFAPIAVALAQSLGHPPEAYVVTVAMAAVTACLTPTGHHGNLLVYGPGRYKFMDFVRVGGLLTILSSLVIAIIAPLLWPV